MKKQTLKQRKAIRSAAAKKGWDTRIARERREIEEAQAFAAEVFAFAEEREEKRRLEPVSGIPDILRGAPPKPSLWQRIKGWVLRAAPPLPRRPADGI